MSLKEKLAEIQKQIEALKAEHSDAEGSVLDEIKADVARGVAKLKDRGEDVETA